MNCLNHLFLVPFTVYRTIHRLSHCSPSPSPYSALVPFVLCTSDFRSRAPVTARTILCTLSFGFGLPSDSSLTLSPFRGKISRLTSSLWRPRASVSCTLSPPSCSIIFTANVTNLSLYNILSQLTFSDYLYSTSYNYNVWPFQLWNATREEAFKNREGTLVQWNMSVASHPGITQKMVPGVPAQKTTLDAGSCQALFWVMCLILNNYAKQTLASC